jgi:hypothetical protein
MPLIIPEPRYFSIPQSSWGRSLEKRGSELDSAGTIGDPGSAGLDELASRDHRGVAENRDQVALPAGFDTQDAEPVLVVVEGDALDQTSQDLRRARRRCLCHPVMMEMNMHMLWDRAPPPLLVSAHQQECRAVAEVVTQFDAVDSGR